MMCPTARQDKGHQNFSTSHQRLPHVWDARWMPFTRRSKCCKGPQRWQQQQLPPQLQLPPQALQPRRPRWQTHTPMHSLALARHLPLQILPLHSHLPPLNQHPTSRALCNPRPHSKASIIKQARLIPSRPLPPPHPTPHLPCLKSPPTQHLPRPLQLNPLLRKASLPPGQPCPIPTSRRPHPSPPPTPSRPRHSH